MEHMKDAFAKVGWFIPPYVMVGYLQSLVSLIDSGHVNAENLSDNLASLYSPASLAAMVTERYPQVPYVSDYQKIISESVEAHFMGSNHIAVSGLMPVIEGAGRKLLESRGLTADSIKNVFVNLANDCKKEVVEKRIGAVGEIVEMLNSFIDFTDGHLYINSARYPLSDNTNRHGILHGAYADADYGEVINFYKTIGAINFLCFVASLRASISGFAPSTTQKSETLAAYYVECQKLSITREAFN
jgi:hypothetical protein